MKLDGIETFVMVAEAGSLSEAARRQGLAKSVVSERLAELERSLGCRLIRRTTRHLALTEDGQAFLERARRITQEIAEAAADLALRRGSLSGPLRLSAPVTFGRMHLGPALYPFLAAHPEIRLTLDLDDRRVDAQGSGYDGVLRHGPIIESRLVAWRLAPSRRRLVAAPSYLARYGKPAGLADLETHRGIFYTNRGDADWRFGDGKFMVTARALPILRVNNGDMILDAALAGLGVALLPLFIAGQALAEGRLTDLPMEREAAAEFVYLAHPEGHNPSTKLRALADHLRKAFGSPPYWEKGLAL